MALAFGSRSVQTIQPFIDQRQWQGEKSLKKHWQLVDETGEDDALWIVDGSEFPKNSP
jgi:hypothetical protein